MVYSSHQVEHSTGEESSDSSLGLRSALILILPRLSSLSQRRGWLRGDVALAMMGSHFSFIDSLVVWTSFPL